MIILAGDSWGVSAYSKNCQMFGPGLGQWLLKCVDVVNLSRGAGSNTRSLYKLEKFLERYTPLPQDRFLWIVTGPDRCVKDVDKFLSSEKSIYELLHLNLVNSLERANEIAKRSSIKLEVIGGVCDLTSIAAEEYSNLIFVVPSWCELLTNKHYPAGTYVPGIVDPAFVQNLGAIIKAKYPSRLSQLLEVMNYADIKGIQWDRLRRTFFKTDGWHPDSDGHLLLLKHLFPTLNKYY